MTAFPPHLATEFLRGTLAGDEQGLDIIEAGADRILAETGLRFEGDPETPRVAAEAFVPWNEGRRGEDDPHRIAGAQALQRQVKRGSARSLVRWRALAADRRTSSAKAPAVSPARRSTSSRVNDRENNGSSASLRTSIR